MTNKEFKKSQEDCARMLGMTPAEYENYCTTLKVPRDICKSDNEDKTKELMDYFGITDDMLKKRG